MSVSSLLSALENAVAVNVDVAVVVAAAAAHFQQPHALADEKRRKVDECCDVIAQKHKEMLDLLSDARNHVGVDVVSAGTLDADFARRMTAMAYAHSIVINSQVMYHAMLDVHHSIPIKKPYRGTATRFTIISPVEQAKHDVVMTMTTFATLAHMFISDMSRDVETIAATDNTEATEKAKQFYREMLETGLAYAESIGSFDKYLDKKKSDANTDADIAIPSA